MDKHQKQLFNMPDWLLKSDNFIAQSDKDTFVNRSILSFIGILARIKTQDRSKTGGN